MPATRFSPAHCPRLIVKIGSALLVDPDGKVRRDWLEGVVADIAARHAAGQAGVVAGAGGSKVGPVKPLLDATIAPPGVPRPAGPPRRAFGTRRSANRHAHQCRQHR
jgi:hypothetical protein